jgi:hypothetical protein
MKRKDLYEYVRQEIINELSTNENVTITKDSTLQAAASAAKGEGLTDTTVIANAIKTAKTSGKPVTLVTKVAESDLEEARKGNNLKAGPNFAAIKSAYAGSVIERILNAIEETGDVGIEPKNIQAAIGFKNSSELNPIIGELKELGAIVGPAPKEKAEPEEITPEDDLANLGIPKVTDNPEDKEVDDDELVAVEDDEYYKPEEEEDSTEDEIKIDPKTADKDAKKTFGTQSLNKKILSNEEEEKYKKISTGINDKITRLEKLPKNKRINSPDYPVLKALLSNTNVKKLYKDKGVNLPTMPSVEVK